MIVTELLTVSLGWTKMYCFLRYFQAGIFKNCFAPAVS